jgi:hypothetical protein
VSRLGGRAARWSRDGSQLYYINDDKLMVVRVTEHGETLTVGTPAVRARQAYFGGTVPNYSVAGDGRVLMVRREAPPAVADRLIVVQDWLAQLTTGSKP